LAGHDARQVVEHVALDHLAAFAGAGQLAPVDVVLLGKALRQRGDVWFTHCFLQVSRPRAGHDATLQETAIRPDASSTTSSRPDSPPGTRPPQRYTPPRRAPGRPGRQAWKKTSSMYVCSMASWP